MRNPSPPRTVLLAAWRAALITVVRPSRARFLGVGIGADAGVPRSACRFPRAAGTVPHARHAARQRGTLCTFHGYPALVLFAPSTAIGTDSTTTCFSYRDSGSTPSSAFLYGVEPE